MLQLHETHTKKKVKRENFQRWQSKMETIFRLDEKDREKQITVMFSVKITLKINFLDFIFIIMLCSKIDWDIFAFVSVCGKTI